MLCFSSVMQSEKLKNIIIQINERINKITVKFNPIFF